MSKKTISRPVKPSKLDLESTAGAFEALRPELDAIPRGEVISLRVDPQLAAAFAFSVARRDSAPERRARLAALEPTGLFHAVELDRLLTCSLATFHARRRQLEVSDVASGARVPEAMLRDAQERRARMLRVLEYYFGDLPEHAARQAAIRAGTGYQDLANDLLALHDYYLEADVARVITRDTLHYRADDTERAAAQAHELFAGLGLTREGEAVRWLDLTQRAYTLLMLSYDKLRAVGQLVFRLDEDVDVTYPSLVSAVRAAPARAVDGDDPAEGGGSAAAADATGLRGGASA